MLSSYHTHTWRCRHAGGTEREYIETAIKAGMRTLGFSDHSPMPFPNGFTSGHRMACSQTEEYVNTLISLREEYKGQIDIKIGYEAEYYPLYFDAFLEHISQYECDYIIIGQHFINNELKEHGGIYSGQSTDNTGYLRLYVDTVIAAMNTGRVTYIAHPDLMDYTGDKKIFDREYGRLIQASVDTKTPLEINLLGVRDNRRYPHDRFFELCGEYGAEITIGSDAHSPDVVSDDRSFEKALNMCERMGLKFVQDPVLKKVTD